MDMIQKLEISVSRRSMCFCACAYDSLLECLAPLHAYVCKESLSFYELSFLKFVPFFFFFQDRSSSCGEKVFVEHNCTGCCEGACNFSLHMSLSGHQDTVFFMKMTTDTVSDAKTWCTQGLVALAFVIVADK